MTIHRNNIYITTYVEIKYMTTITQRMDGGNEIIYMFLTYKLNSAIPIQGRL